MKQVQQASAFRRVSRLALLAVGLAAAAAVFWPAGPQPAEPAEPSSAAVQDLAPTAAAVVVALPQAPAGPAGRHTPRSPAPACPLQRLEVAAAGQPAVVACVDATRLSQTGNVRSYLAAGSGHAAWALKVDVAAGRLLAVRLREGSGAEYACEAEACQGLQWSGQGGRGGRSLQLERVALARAGTSGQPEVNLTGRLEIPAEDAFSAPGCDGPAVMLRSPDGRAHRFCGQGGAGVELTDAGGFTYRFEDAEGQTLAVSVDADQRVAEVRYGPWACRAAACTGATASSVAPGGEWSGRSFLFGHTPLFGSADAADARAAVPQLVLDGSLALPSGES